MKLIDWANEIIFRRKARQDREEKLWSKSSDQLADVHYYDQNNDRSSEYVSDVWQRYPHLLFTSTTTYQCRESDWLCVYTTFLGKGSIKKRKKFSQQVVWGSDNGQRPIKLGKFNTQIMNSVKVFNSMATFPLLKSSYDMLIEKKNIQRFHSLN